MSDINSLQQTGYQFILDKTPNLDFRVQKVHMPRIHMGSAQLPTPFVKYNMPGNVEYGDLTVDFLVSESMSEYMELIGWLQRNGNVDMLGEFPTVFQDSMSDVMVVILNSSSLPIMSVTFSNAFPVDISPLEFDSTVVSPTYIRCSASFAFTSMTFNPILPTS